jgi:hypothetical protein
MLFHPVIERHADDRSRKAGNDDLAPEAPGRLSSVLALRGRERVQLIEEQHDDSEDGTKLDHDEEHVPEVLRDIESDELVQKEHMAGRGNRQPFGDAFDEAVERSFQKLDNGHRYLPPTRARTLHAHNLSLAFSSNPS